MKTLQLTLFAALLIVMGACGSSKSLGKKVNEPFSSSKYESNKRYWRAVGKGASSNDNVAKGKADIQAKKELAQQVQTRMKVVTDQYFSDTETLNSEELNDKFQSLIREVTNTQIADLRKIGEEKYFNEETGDYTVFLAYEIHKKKMLRFMKKYARTNAKLDKVMLKSIEDMIDKELEELERIDPE